MADVTISGLPNAATPLDGSERVPMDKGGVTVDASTADVAATLPEATDAAAGKMSAADKAKLDSIATGATANSSDADLLDRDNHTGTQGAETITGLADVATSGAYADLSGTPGVATTSTAGLQAATSFATITYAASIELDLAALDGQYRTIALTGVLEFTTVNRAAGRMVSLRLVCDGTGRALTFPAGWVFVGTKPTTLAASKTAALSLTFYGTADTDCVAAYAVQT